MGLYSVWDYVVYLGILLVLFVFFQRFFEKVRFDVRLIKAVSPYIFFGTFVRVLVDVGVVEFNQLWSVTPGVYIMSTAVALFFLLLGLLIEKKTGVSHVYLLFSSGLVLSLYVFSLITPYITHPYRMLVPLILSFLITLTVYVFSLIVNGRLFMEAGSLCILYAHMLDASSTYIAYNFYNFYEEHLLPNYLISLMGGDAFIMIPVKLMLIAVTLYFLEKWRAGEEKTEKTRTQYLMIKFLIFVIGIGPGIRNTMLPSLNL